MTNLSCNAASCVNNYNDCCCLNSIMVKGECANQCTDTNCESYRYPSDNKAFNSNGSPKLSLSISCAAKNCMYNMNSMCEADHVDISGIKATKADDTVCTTFKER